jgi:CRISPR-associated protein Cas5h
MGNYVKTNIKYSDSTGFNNKDKDNNPATRLTEELTLVNPEYRIYLLLDEDDEYQKQLINSIQKGCAEFIPYFGKNEFTAWWSSESYKEYHFTEQPILGEKVRIKSIFDKKTILKNNTEVPFDLFNFDEEETPFIYFERLPKDFDLALMQYDIAEFAYSNYFIKNASQLDNLFFIDELNAYVQML